MRAPPTARLLQLLVVTHDPERDAPDGVGAMLRQLGADVRVLGLWDDFARACDEAARGGGGVRAMVFESADRPDLAAGSLRAARKVAPLSATPALLALPARQITSFDPGSGFGDFVVMPCASAEIYARLRALEWHASEFANEERLKIGEMVVDRAAHEVSLGGRRVTLTTKEFALLAYLATHRGRVHTRESLLARVWGARYEGGARTVDVHVRRLRAKLGDALPLETLRGAGYKLRAP